MKILLFLILGAVAIIALAWITARILEPRLLYKPTKSYSEAALRSESHEWVRIPTDDGVSLSALRLPNPDSSLQLLFLSDNRGNVVDHMPRLAKLRDSGFSVLAIDYRGFGNSSGAPSELGLYEDARAGFDYLKRRYTVDDKAIVVFGRSLGGAVALELATHTSPRALIIESTFASLRELQAERSTLPLYLLLPDRFTSAARADKITHPVLLIHGDADTEIQLRHSKALFEAFQQSPSRVLRILKGSGHFDTHENPRYVEYIRSFIEQIENPNAPSAISD